MNPDKVVLYGSYSRNEQTDESDIDIAVIFDGFTDNWLEESSKLWRIAWDIDDRIEPVLLDISNDESGFCEEVMRVGIKL